MIMTKPCAVFWDIQNIDVPKGQTVDSIVNTIRSTIIKPYNLNEIYFYCVCDIHKLPPNVEQSLTKLDVDIVQANNKAKDSADIKILDLMRRFVKLAGQDCSIILLSGDADYYVTLNDLKKLHNVSIHLIRLDNSFSPKLDQISDYTFILNNGTLKPIKSTGSPMYFISIKDYPLMDINFVMTDLNTQTTGSIQNSAILFENKICIGFPTLWNAEKAIEKLNGSRFHGTFLKAEFIADSPLLEILKCIRPDVIVQTEGNNEVKQLTFIKINNLNEAGDTHKVIKFCIACTAQSGSQCILSRKSFLWIVFSFKSNAQKCLSNVQIMYPDAVITEPPNDLTVNYHESPYTVESCKPRVQNEVSSRSVNSNITIVKTENAEQVSSSQKQSLSNIRHPQPCPSTSKPELSYQSVTLKKSTNTEPRRVPMPNASDDNVWKIFFRCDNHFVIQDLNYPPSKWSLLFGLFEKLYDLGAKKVIFDGKFYCAHFDSVTTYQDAFEKKRSRNFKPLESINLPRDYNEHKVTKIINGRSSEIPWRLTAQLDLHCLVMKLNSKFHDKFREISKNILGTLEAIFIKSIPGEIWIGFPDELICRNSKKTVLRALDSLNKLNDVLVMKPSNRLLESINFEDLVGSAYDLAFISSQLDSSRPIPRPGIFQQIRQQRIQEKECDGTVFSISITGDFHPWPAWAGLSLEQIVKIFVNFSKVIPIAATASYEKVDFSYHSLHEAHTASHFINKLTRYEVPYFIDFYRASEIHEHQLAFFKYYAINDKRKILEMMLHNKRLVDEPSLNLSTVQSISDIDILDVKITEKLQYLFIITTDSRFNFTSGMIKIIKMHLLQMECSACIEFENELWVGVDDLEKGNKAKSNIEQIKFKILHENDDDDFEVGVVMQAMPSSPIEVAKMLAHKIINPAKARVSNVRYKIDTIQNPFPLGYFNYNYREAVRIPISQYFYDFCHAW